jgi:hypothetical protein
MAIIKPPVIPPWADTAAPGTDVVQPTNAEISAGWVQSTTPPSRQRYNWILNFLANAVRYFSRRGIPDYDPAETYQPNDLIRGNDSFLYQSEQNNNIGHTPSSSPSWWNVPHIKTLSAGDNTTRIANAAFVQTAISGKANTSGNYPQMSVGSATNAANAAVASSAGSVPWSGVTGRPNTVGGYGISDAITTANIGSQSVYYAAYAARAYPYRWDGNEFRVYWSGQGGQPTWLLGSNDGINWYVWNPSNFNVNAATWAYYANTQAAGTSDTSIATTQFANPSQSRAGNGYVMLPGGIILQWGAVHFGDLAAGFGSNARNISFPATFPSACLQVVCSRMNGAVGAVPGARFVSNSSFQIVMEEWSGVTQASDNSVSWFAIGY